MLRIALWTLGVGYLGIGFVIGTSLAEGERKLAKKAGRALKTSDYLYDIAFSTFLWLPVLISVLVFAALIKSDPDE